MAGARRGRSRPRRAVPAGPRRVKLFVGISLDGFIAGPNEEVDWLFTDRDYGLAAFWKTVDAVLIGRRTYDFMVRQGERSYPGMRNYVFSRTPRRSGQRGVEFVAGDPAEFVRELRGSAGKDIWLCGGARLFAHLLRHDRVDDILLAVHPLVLGGGIALFPPDGPRTPLELVRSTPYETGLVVLEYQVRRGA